MAIKDSRNLTKFVFLINKPPLKSVGVTQTEWGPLCSEPLLPSSLQPLSSSRTSGRQSNSFRSFRWSFLRRLLHSERSAGSRPRTTRLCSPHQLILPVKVESSWSIRRGRGSLIPATHNEVRCGERLSTDIKTLMSELSSLTWTVSSSRGSSAREM